MKIICRSGRELHVRKTLATHSHETGSYNLLEVAFIERVGDDTLVTSWVTGGRRDSRSCPIPTADKAKDQGQTEAPASAPAVKADASPQVEEPTPKPEARRFGFF